MQQRSAAAVAVRKPLVRRSTKAAAVRMFNPRFEEDFAANKYYDPDRQARLRDDFVIQMSLRVISVPRI